jgi:uncharacterized protein (DUF58 family)
LGVSAVNTGNNLIYLITAAFLSFLGVSGVFGKSNIAGVTVELGVLGETYSNREFPLKVRLVNRQRFLPFFLIRVRIGSTETIFPYVGIGASEEKYINMVAGRRGRHTINAVTVSSTFPFNLFVRFRSIKTSIEYIVFPEPKKCALDSFLDTNRMAMGETTSNQAGYEGELMSVRNYSYGDPMKYIHWKASAKSQELKTKELSALSQRPVVIDFENTGIKNREERISCVTYLLLLLYRRNIPAGLRIGGLEFVPGTSTSHKTDMIRELALYGEEHDEI